MSDIVLRAENIHKTYTLGSQTLQILKGVDLEVRRGEILGIVGASGVGKSTLLHIIGLLDRPDMGNIWFEGKNVTASSGRRGRARIRNREMGFVFQFYHLLPELTALENVLLTPMMGSGVLGWFPMRKKAKKKAADVLDSLGLGDRLRHRPPQLSGGERQRVAIARALMSDPGVLLCDEPTGNLDENTSSTIIDLLMEINRDRKQTMILVTHNDSLARCAERLVRLSGGILGEEDPTRAARLQSP